MKRRLLLAAMGSTALFGPHASAAEAWPTRPVRLIVGFTPGGIVDETARLIATHLAAHMKITMVVENKPGVASLLAAEHVADSARDGHTLLLGSSSMLIARHQLNRSTADISRFSAISPLSNAALILVASPKFPASDPQAFVREIRANPGKYFYSTAGVGSIHHLSMEILKKQLKLDIEHVPYRGATAMLPDLVSGQVPLAVMSAGGAEEQEKAGRLKVLGLMNPTKWSNESSWRPMAEVAPGFGVSSTLQLLGPAGMPNEVVQRLNNALKTILGMPEIADHMARQGAQPKYSSSADLQADLQLDNQRWLALVKELNLQER
ncbi:Bug family tripartite tricarboxylate transporter substrate binding protein [Hydrogenophaga sp. BPS33]|uniref:Bug family tripartite tricarboxylate transporter substrate binding protein n=1 Tax=Hydrogenophaga sp. BPS33 TaxID=2651974 RepID=UPI0013200945|nr:tripartite tricarboxylate transporter substrate binding protein [Hydrogenophaga sp. BPS33]QHE84679.1 tripartite tricarboxylate transporter substrate binding protein [Hydrogenophaga sp. BPS33]